MPSSASTQRRTDRARTAAQVDDDGALACQRERLAHQQLAASPRHEHPGSHDDPQAAELRPAQQVLQGNATRAPAHQRGKLRRRVGGLDEQTRLVLGEDATGSAKFADRGGVVGAGRDG